MGFEAVFIVAGFNEGLIQMESIYLWVEAKRINSFLVARDKLGVDKIAKGMVLQIRIGDKVSVINGVNSI
jgi:hypothetical protein